MPDPVSIVLREPCHRATWFEMTGRVQADPEIYVSYIRVWECRNLVPRGQYIRARCVIDRKGWHYTACSGEVCDVHLSVGNFLVSELHPLDLAESKAEPPVWVENQTTRRERTGRGHCRGYPHS